MTRWCALVALALTGCTWFSDDEPSRTCRSNRDCFVAQGEICSPATMTCEQVDTAAVTGNPDEAPP